MYCNCRRNRTVLLVSSAVPDALDVTGGLSAHCEVGGLEKQPLMSSSPVPQRCC